MTDEPPRQPLVSIVVPAYDAEDSIVSAIESVLAQTYTSIEVVVVDDCSTDSTAALVEELSERDTRVRPIRQIQNSGVGATCNVGLGEARGEWVAIVDSDDWIVPGRVQMMIDAAERSGATMIFDNLLVIPEGKPVAHGQGFVAAASELFGPLALETFASSISSASSLPNLGYLRPMFAAHIVADRSVRFDEHLKVGEDSLFYCELFANGGSGFLLPDVGYHYYRRGGSLSSEFGADRIAAMRDAYAGLVDRSGRALTPAEVSAIGSVVDDLDRRLEANRVLGELSASNLRAVATGLARSGPDRRYLYRELRRRAGRFLRS